MKDGLNKGTGINTNINDKNKLETYSLQKDKIYLAYTVDEILNGIEKMRPKKPRKNERQNIRFMTAYICDNCGEVFYTINATHNYRFCYHCGQALDWSDKE